MLGAYDNAVIVQAGQMSEGQNHSHDSTLEYMKELTFIIQILGCVTTSIAWCIWSLSTPLGMFRVYNGGRHWLLANLRLTSIVTVAGQLVVVKLKLVNNKLAAERCLLVDGVVVVLPASVVKV